VKSMAIPCLPKIGKTTCAITLLLLVFFLGPSSLGAQGKSLSSHKRAGRKSRVEFHGHKQRAGNFRGRRQDGALVWSQSFGMADLENFVPATSLTLFRLGSISKPITATAILQLSERGKLDLDVEAQEYCRAFPKKSGLSPLASCSVTSEISGITTRTAVPHRSSWYHKDKSGAVENAGVLDSSYKIPGGGLISSADDMTRFEIAVLANKLLKPATREQMWTPQMAADGSENGYALGWGHSKKFGLSLVSHSGS